MQRLPFILPTTLRPFKQMGKSQLQRLLIIQLCSIPVWADTSLPWSPHAYRRELALPKLYPPKCSLPSDFERGMAPLYIGSPSGPPSFSSLNTWNKLHDSRDYLQQWPYFQHLRGTKTWLSIHSHLLNEWNIRKILAVMTANLENSTSSAGPGLCT